jgi:hypothetical protein
MMLALSMWMVAGSAFAQPYPYGNEWIDYGKTYYKLKVFPNNGSTSAQNNNNDNKAKLGMVHRIVRNTLVANALSNVPAQDFQLWRNGEEVALYTSVASGSLGGADGQQFTTVSKLQALQRQAATTYQFLHTQPIQCNNFYRLKITNNDGSAQYSAIRQLGFGADFNVKTMPNPLHNTLNISIIGESKPTQIKLLDTKGQLLLQTIAMQNISLNTANLPSGIYMVLATNSRGQ